MAEGARLESVYTATYRGFESPPHRHILRRARTQVRAFFFACGTHRGDENPPTGVRQLATPVGQTASLRAGCPAGASEASQSPPHRHILRRARTQVRAFFSHVAPAGGDENPDRGSTTGNASWTDREPASGLPRRGERSESIPPSPPYFKKSSYASTGFFFACGTCRGG